MTPTDVSAEIENRIALLGKGRKLLQERAENKANQNAIYERELAKTIMGLKNGNEYELDGERIQSPPATIIEKLARGICWQQAINRDLAEAEYKNAIVGIDTIQSELNGYQSINRHLDNS